MPSSDGPVAPTVSFRRRQIALLHFSALPEIGGIEQLIQHQIDALEAAGHAVCLIVGSGDRPRNAQFHRIAEISPAFSLGEEHLTRRNEMANVLSEKIRIALVGCDQCWVHNAFTVNLHPALTDALHRLVQQMPGVQFVNWCSDISVISQRPDHISLSLLAPLAKHIRLKHVTISRVRRSELAACSCLREADIEVIGPPVDVLQWLDAGSDTRKLVQDLGLLGSDLVVLIPAKLLPHKNLNLALEVAAEWQAAGVSFHMLISGSDSPHQPRESARLRRELSQLIAQRNLWGHVHLLSAVFHGPVPLSVVQDLMRLADLVFVPSTEEGFGMPLLESALMRTPCLCADIPAFREAGGPATAYFHLTDSPAQVARRALALANGPENVHRRRTIRSLDRFFHDVAGFACADGLE